MHSAKFDQVREKLERFSRRYYFDSFLSGLGIFLSTSLLLLLVISTAEFISPNTSLTRAILWYTFLLLEIAGLIYLLVIPLLRTFGMNRNKSEMNLAHMVGQRMREIDDRLMNVLQLQRMNKSNDSLLVAAIDQKSSLLSEIPFHESAGFRRGYKFLKVAAAIVVAAFLASWTFPEIVQYGTKRIVYYDTNIEPPAPFQFELTADELTAVKHEALEVLFAVKGSLIPKEVFIEIDGHRSGVKKLKYDEFGYTFNHVRESFAFRLYAEGYYSKEYKVTVIERPAILSFNVAVKYPAYLSLQDEVFHNQGNLSVPEGSVLEWNIETQKGSSVLLEHSEVKVVLNDENGMASHRQILNASFDYRLWATNSQGLESTPISYMIEVMKDEFPKIEVDEILDSTRLISRYLGNLTDDHGLSHLKIVYTRKGMAQPESRDIQIKSSAVSQEFLYEIDWNSWDLKSGEGIEYYFEVWDNDGIHGKKSTKSQRFYFGIPDKEEMEQAREDLADKIEDRLEKALKDARELNKEIEQLRKDMLVKENKIDWDKKKQLEEIIQKREDLQQEVMQVQNQNEKKNKLENQLQSNEQLLEKHRDLQDLMERIMDEKTLEMLKELQKMMSEINKEEMERSMEQMEISNKDLENQLDRSLELFKQMEYAQKLEDVIQKLEETKKDQDKLNDELETGKDKPENLKEDQERINEEFDEVKKELEKLAEMNEELENKHELEDLEKEKQDVDESQDKASESLQKNQKSKAGEQQKKASEGMSQMQKKMQNMQMGMQAQAMEDVQSLRNSLENLLELSFRQEELMQEMKSMRGDDPRFRELTMDQRGTLDGMKLVEDSLNALSKRVAKIAPTVNKELGEAKRSMERALKLMTERRLEEVQVEQQRSMTSINNLAVLLDEIIRQLQNMMSSPSSGQCQKPGKGKPNPMSLQQLQKKLNQQMQEMQKMQEKGDKPGNKPGSEGKGGESQAESLAKMAAEQAKIREALRQLEEGSNQEDGKGWRKIGEMMEETEKDIVNRNITRETLLRQQNILTRMLESERAEKERDKDNKRESRSGEEKNIGNLLDLKEYYKARNSEHERLMKENVSYNRFYKEKVEEYFKTISE